MLAVASYRRGLVGLATLVSCAALIGPLFAQQPPLSPATPEAAQLDRIERKLDDILRRLDGPVAGRTAQTPSPAPSAITSPVTPEADYRPGALAVIHAAPARSAQLAEVPADSVGGFVYTCGGLTLHDLSRRGVRYAGLAGVELQGWLKVKEAFSRDASVWMPRSASEQASGETQTRRCLTASRIFCSKLASRTVIEPMRTSE